MSRVTLCCPDHSGKSKMHSFLTFSSASIFRFTTEQSKWRVGEPNPKGDIYRTTHILMSQESSQKRDQRIKEFSVRWCLLGMSDAAAKVSLT